MSTLRHLLASFTVFLSFAGFCSAQPALTTTLTPTSFSFSSFQSTTSNEIQTHTINVGKESYQYSPDTVSAAVGDVIEFQFFPPNHSVARAQYGYPCVPYESTGTDKVGFYSGFYSVTENLDNPPRWNLTINDTNPIFFYCALKTSCIDNAMVGVINPNSSESLLNQQEEARKASFVVVPGGRFPTGETPASIPAMATGNTNSFTSFTSITSPPSSSDTATASYYPPRSSSGQGLSDGAIAGIVIGGVVGLSLVGVLIFCLGRNRTELKFLRRDLHTRNRRIAPPNMTVQFDNLPPTSPSMRYDPDDPRFGEHQSDYVPPYVKYPDSPTPQTPELASTEVVNSRPRSPRNHGGEKKRDTASPRPMELMESIAPEVGYDNLSGNEVPGRSG
ncbi:MAG: hypothetical protein Q9191_005455 [Dirinaria sp. TL-2023a]